MKPIIQKLWMVTTMLLLSISASAYDFEVDGFYYEVNLEKMTATVVSGENQQSGDVTVPSIVTYKGKEFSVVAIKGAFSGNTNLISVTIPNTITTLGVDAFAGCSSLKSISGINNIKELGASSFKGCELLSSVELPLTLEKIGSDAFGGCKSLTDISVPKNVILIDSRAFSDCIGLSSISLPSTLTNLSNGLFENCESLRTFEIPEAVTSIGNYVFKGCKSLESLFIPKSVQTIGNGTFSGCTNLGKVIIENGTTPLSVGYGEEYEEWNDTYRSPLFIDCPINSVSIGRNLHSKSGYWRTNWGCFAQNASLSDVVLSPSVTSIEEGAFMDCNALSSIIIPGSVTSIGEWAFAKSGLKSITFEDGYQDLKLALSVGSWEFNTPHTFQKCTLEKVYLGRNIMISGGAQNPGYGGNPSTLFPTTLSEIKIGNYVNNIKAILKYNQKETFSLSHYPNLSLIRIGVGLESLPSLENNTELKNLELESIIPPLASNFSNSQYMDLNVEIPLGSMVSYQEAPIWKNFWQFEENEELLTCIEDNGLLYQIISPYKLEVIKKYEPYKGDVSVPSHVFYNGTKYEVISIGEAFNKCNDLKSISITESVAYLKNKCFENCSSLSSVTLNNNIDEIPSEAFKNCSSLQSIVLPNRLKNIHAFAFSGCTKLMSLSCPQTLEYIGESAFEKCTLLKEFSFNTGIKSIGHSVFNGCVSIEELEIPTSIRSIPSQAFYECKNLKLDELKVAEVGSQAFEGCSSITNLNCTELLTIASDAFRNCSSLQNIELGNNLISIGDNAFSNCYSLSSLTLPPSLQEIGTSLFSGCRNLRELILADGDKAIDIPSGNYDDATGIQKKEINGKTIQFKIQFYNGYFDNLPIEKLYIGRNLSNKSRYTINGDGGVDYYLITSYDAPFSSLSKLKELIIAENVSILGPDEEYISEVEMYSTPGSFKNCGAIETVTVNNMTPPLGAEFSTSVYNNAKLIVPDNTIPLFQVVTGWKDFLNIADESSAGIDNIALDKERTIRCDSTGIYYCSKGVQSVSVYNIDGKLVKSAMLQQGEKVMLSSGFYIVKVGNDSFKVKI